jgi:hypothetical protein
MKLDRSFTLRLEFLNLIVMKILNIRERERDLANSLMIPFLIDILQDY